ncbi:MAG: hypothetical protein EOP85_05740 [Verrucomicrobiaceae bacterium]|nr:MAG: hypothetical protein EOP85_05740 [Verrucomicrobiaceae bacterium]
MYGIFLPDRLDKGFAFLAANRNIYQSGLEEGFVRQALKSAADRGPDAVNGVLRMIREGNVDTRNAYMEFPPDFDFQTLASAGELKTAVKTGAGSPALRAWAMKDRDAAYQWTMENAGGGGACEILLGRRNQGGPQDVAWSAARYEEMDADQRKALSDSARHFMTRDMEWIPAFSDAIRDPVLKEELRLRAVQGLFNGRNYLAERMLEVLGPPERRLEILENLQRDPQVTPPMPLDEERLRKKISAWTQDQSRIDAIINHLKS